MTPYTTTSLHLAAWLLAKGHPIKVTGSTLHQRVFEFDSAAAEEDASLFYQNGLIAARLYSAALNDLKKLIHQTPNSNPNEDPHSGRARRR